MTTILDWLNQSPIPIIDESQLFTTTPKLDQSTNFKWMEEVEINMEYLANLSAQFEAINLDKIVNKKAILLNIIQMIDLTALSGDDTDKVIQKLTQTALKPLSIKIELKQNIVEVRTAAVCVYPARVKDVMETLNNKNARGKVKVASVAAGFPSGQYLLETRLHEIKSLAAQDVDEIDIVIQRPLALMGQWTTLYDEVKQMKEACGKTVHMKTILGVGELASSNNIYRASVVSMLAGSDFIKTSTGKEKTNATIPAGIIMSIAIRHYHKLTGKKIGLKPAGGISTYEDCVKWIYMLVVILGAEWFNKDLFRIGASSLLADIVKEFEKSE